MSERLAWPPRKEDLERFYLIEKLSAAKIATVYGLKYKNPKVAESTVLYQLRRNGIPRRDRAEHVRKVTPEMVDEWGKRYNAGESLKQIAGGEVSPVTVWLQLRRRGINLRDKVEAQIEAITKYAKRPFSGDPLEEAYLMGLRTGDLHVVVHGRAIRVRVSTTHPAMADLFESIFGNYGHVARYPRRAPLSGYEWTLESDLDWTFEFLLGKANAAHLGKLPIREFLAFLAGFVDAEGTIYLHKKRFGLAFELLMANTDLALLKSIAKMLTRMSFHPFIRRSIQDPTRLGYDKPGEIYRLTIWRREEVRKLLEILVLRHQERVQKAKFALGRLSQVGYKMGKKDIVDWRALTKEIKDARDVFVKRAQATVSIRTVESRVRRGEMKM